MIIILTEKNEFLPKKYQISNYPFVINGITTLNNLEITPEILNNDDLYDAYLNQYLSNLNSYNNSIIILNKNFPINNITTNYKIIEINELINEKKLEELINENINN